MSSAAHATADGRPQYTRAERVADAAVHGLAIAGAGVAATALIATAAASRDGGHVAAAAIYATALLAMPCVSAAYHLGPWPEHRDVLRRLDQATIFILIAGTYTPFGVVALGGELGLALLALVWGAALAGGALKLLRPGWLSTRRSVAFYLLLGWCALPAIGPLAAAVAPVALALLGLGGVLYSVGVIFHLWTTLPFHNAIWHGFVVVAGGCHVFAVFHVLAS